MTNNQLPITDLVFELLFGRPFKPGLPAVSPEARQCLESGEPVPRGTLISLTLEETSERLAA